MIPLTLVADKAMDKTCYITPNRDRILNNADGVRR